MLLAQPRAARIASRKMASRMTVSGPDADWQLFSSGGSKAGHSNRCILKATNDAGKDTARLYCGLQPKLLRWQSRSDEVGYLSINHCRIDMERHIAPPRGLKPRLHGKRLEDFTACIVSFSKMDIVDGT